jgi:hypothetical protein
MLSGDKPPTVWQESLIDHEGALRKGGKMNVFGNGDNMVSALVKKIFVREVLLYKSCSEEPVKCCLISPMARDGACIGCLTSTMPDKESQLPTEQAERKYL